MHGETGALAQAAPVETTKGTTRGPALRFHTTWLTWLLGREEGGTSEEIGSRERRGSRKSDPESVDCGALARLDRSYVPYPRTAHRVHVHIIYRETRDLSGFLGKPPVIAVRG